MSSIIDLELYTLSIWYDKYKFFSAYMNIITLLFKKNNCLDTLGWYIYLSKPVLYLTNEDTNITLYARNNKSLLIKKNNNEVWSITKYVVVQSKG